MVLYVPPSLNYQSCAPTLLWYFHSFIPLFIYLLDLGYTEAPLLSVPPRVPV